MRTNLFYIVLSVYFLTIGSSLLLAQELPKPNKSFKSKNQASKAETASIKQANEQPPIVKKIDTLKVDSIKKFKSALEGKVKYRAKKYAKFDQKKKLITLYDGGELNYLDYELKAGIIVFDYQKNEVYAGRLKDSAGNYTQLPVFKQGSNVIEPDSIRFNYKTKKAIIWNSRTSQQEMNIKTEVVKKENDSVYFMKGARITTAKDLDDPEYYFLARRAKLVPGKKVVVGLTNLYIADVPTPIALPFAFFPITVKSHSGIIPPSFGQNNDRGYALQNGGYYFALSEKYDLAVLGDYYTNGSYAMRFESSYANKYKYSGNVNIRFENLISSERGYPDYAKSKIYNIQWSHSKDTKSNPNSRFSASVNLGSSKYFQQSINQINIGSTLNNTLSSSVSYSKTFNTVPQVNMSLTATHSQNTQTKKINMTLPTLQASVDRVFPFAPKDGIKKGFIKNINLQYNLRGENQIETTDEFFFKKEMFSTARTGFQHTIPLSTNFKIFKYFSSTSSVNYNEVWTLQTIKKSSDYVTNQVVSTRVNGFDSFRTYNFSNSIGTTIYGTFNFKETGKIQSIRHVMRPSISYSYAPSFSKYYEQYETASGYDSYTRFEGSLSTPGNGIAHALGFNLSNTFEAKIRDSDSTATAPKKIMLLNNLNLNSNYDIENERWSNIGISGGTLLFNQKMNVNFGSILSPYALRDTNDNIIANPFRMVSANLTMGYTITSATKEDKTKKNVQGAKNGGRSDDLFGSNNEINNPNQNDDLVSKEDEEDTFSGFYNADIPWDINLAYSITYSNALNERKISSNSLMVSANTDLTPKWKIGVSTGYDFTNKGVTFTQIRLNRDLMSWNMSFNWSPFGQNAYWGFFIGIKAGVLSDIKWDKQTQRDRTLR
ncbi:putative LPS assembly protein LptD [Flavobacterium sp.]|uniref:putative LPS assembly protein LptD n=1 Tax=Flavobacterium sp. TaxID=239 RepID=UPI00374FFD5D